MERVDLGAMRLHVLRTHPGLPGEGDRVAREISRLDPSLVLLDLDTQEGLRVIENMGKAHTKFVPSFVDALFQQRTAERFAHGARAEHPLLVAAKTAQAHRATFVAVRTDAPQPGFFGRMGAKSATAKLAGDEPEVFTRRFNAALKQRGTFDAHNDARRARGRIDAALDDARAPIVLVTQAHRAAAYDAVIKELPRRHAL